MGGKHLTTIAYRDGIISADTMDIFSETTHFGMTKLGRGERCLFGFAGSVRQMPQVFEWLKRRGDQSGHPNTWLKDGVENCDKFDAILIIEGLSHQMAQGRPRTDPKIFRIAPGGICVEYTDIPQFIAIGSGSPFALGAMHAGASAPQAVAAAIRYDLCTGGRVSSVEFTSQGR